MRYFVFQFLTLAICFAAQSYALRAVGGRTIKSESNFFSSIGRIQAGARGNPELMVLGSSITGRLPDRAQGFHGVANMGCDSGNALDTLRAMDDGILPKSPNIIIEANTLHLALDEKPSKIGKAMRKPWFSVGLKVPNLAAYARPSAFIYSKLLAHRIGGFDEKTSDENLGINSKPTRITSPIDETLPANQIELIEETSGIIERLRKQGSDLMIVWLPPARNEDPSAPSWILEIARRNDLRFWDIGRGVAPGTVTLTDDVHMSASSAAKTMNSLLEAYE